MCISYQSLRPPRTYLFIQVLCPEERQSVQWNWIFAPPAHPLTLRLGTSMLDDSSVGSRLQSDEPRQDTGAAGLVKARITLRCRLAARRLPTARQQLN
jgi:hypothetical protein